jgi:hypothetical protein
LKTYPHTIANILEPLLKKHTGFQPNSKWMETRAHYKTPKEGRPNRVPQLEGNNSTKYNMQGTNNYYLQQTLRRTGTQDEARTSRFLAK